MSTTIHVRSTGVTTNAIAFLFTALFAATAFAQSSAIKFVDIEGKPVTPDSALFFNGGRAKTIDVQKGTATAPGSAGIITAHAEGYQYTGAVLTGSDTTVTFYRNDQPCESLSQTPFPLTKEIRSQLQQTIKDKLWDQVHDQPAGSQSVFQIVDVLGSVDPQATLQWVDESNFPGQKKIAVSGNAFTQLLLTRPEEALDRISQIDDSMSRSMILGVFLQRLPPNHDMVPTIEKLLNETSRGIKQPAMRLAIRASLAEHYQLTNRPEQADKITDQHIEEAKKLPTGGWSAYPRSLFAALIAEADPTLAEELITGISDTNEATRARSRVAFACCRKHPDLAKKLLARYEPDKNTITVWKETIKIAHRMVVEQTQSARQLADSIDEPNQKAWALGMMANRLHDSNPQLAKDLLNQTIDLLSDPEATKQDRYAPGQTLAGLLPVAQRIDPAKVRPMIWQAVHVTLPKSRWVSGTSNRVKLQSVAGAIARYDLKLGQTLIGNQTLKPVNIFAKSAFRQALLGPEKLLDYTNELLEHGDHPRQSRLVQEVANLVTVGEASFWNSVSKPMMLDWPTRRFETF